MSLWSRVQRRLGDLAGELVLDEYREYLDRAHLSTKSVMRVDWARVWTR